VGKWEKIEPSMLKVGDEFKLVAVTTEVRGVVADDSDCTYVIDENLEGWKRSQFQAKWFRRKPAKPTRPAEPPAGTVVKNVRTGEVGVRDHDSTAPWEVVKPEVSVGASSLSWSTWIQPGDEIQIAEWS